MKISPKNLESPNRDRFILSKGHASAALFATLTKKGFFDKKTLYGYCQDGCTLAEHPEIHLPGIEATTGSLGHGLSLGVGMSLAAKLDSLSYRTFVVLSDGECDEGSTWEAGLSASHFGLDNLCAVVDYNKFQAFGRTNEVVRLEPFREKWQSFGWSVKEIDAHNIISLCETLSNLPFEPNKPSLIIAHSIMGKGISFMEDKLEWHYNTMEPEQYDSAINEIKKQINWEIVEVEIT